MACNYIVYLRTRGRFCPSALCAFESVKISDCCYQIVVDTDKRDAIKGKKTESVECEKWKGSCDLQSGIFQCVYSERGSTIERYTELMHLSVVIIAKDRQNKLKKKLNLREI